jgi:hypothetical protein
MRNFKEETIEVLSQHGKTLKDIEYFTNEKYYITVEQFLNLLNLTDGLDYDDGYGSQVINSALKGIGKDFIIVREEYDGAEWWRFISLVKPEQNMAHESMLYERFSYSSYDDFELDEEWKKYNK